MGQKVPKHGFPKCGPLLIMTLVSEQSRKGPFRGFSEGIIVKVLEVLENNL